MSNLTVKVVQQDNRYCFTIIGFEKAYEIWYSDSSDFTNKKLLAKNDKESMIVESPKEGRLFFEAVDSQGRKSRIATRSVMDTGVVNFRDIGGYINSEGKQVKWGKFYRSGGLTNLSDSNKEYLDNMGLKTIFDFRSESEVLLHPDQLPNGAEYINRSGIITMNTDKDLFSQARKGNLDMTSLVLKCDREPEMLESLDGYLYDSYATMIEHSGAFRDLFSTISAKKGEPLLFHCTAGKDRTGVAAALILMILGVSKEVIMKDYMITNIYREKETKKTLAKVHQHTSNPKVIRLVRDMIEVQQPYLDNMFNTISKNYNSDEEFFKVGLGLTGENIAELKESYLEDY